MTFITDLALNFIASKNKFMRIAVLAVAILTMITTLVVLALGEVKKQDFTDSQIQIETTRIKDIDKKLSGLYQDTYNAEGLPNGDSLNLSGNLKTIKFLKDQRKEALDNLDLIYKSPSSELFVLMILAVVLTLSVIVFFSNSFTMFSSSSKKRGDVGTIYPRRGMHSEAFFDWIVRHEIVNSDLGHLDIDRAKKFKEIHDYAERLGEDKGRLLQSVMSLLNLKRQQDYEENDKYAEVVNVFLEIQSRLKDECVRLNRHALLNLFLSFVISFGLLGFIIYISLNSIDLTGTSTFDSFIIKYLPRIVSVIGILTMFLYFTKLYKANILDVKYYNNELTNIETKMMGVNAAITSGNNETIDYFIKDLISTERNFLLRKDQTTSEIERIRIENDVNKDFLTKILDLLSIGRDGIKKT